MLFEKKFIHIIYLLHINSNLILDIKWVKYKIKSYYCSIFNGTHPIPKLR